MRVEKKILREYFDTVDSGQKTYELRLADWEINQGDELLLKEWDPEKKVYTGRSIIKKVGFVGKTKEIDSLAKLKLTSTGFKLYHFSTCSS